MWVPHCVMEDLVLADPGGWFQFQLPAEPETSTGQGFPEPVLSQCARFGDQVVLLTPSSYLEHPPVIHLCLHPVNKY